MIGLNQVHTELDREAILNGEGLFLVSGRNEKRLPSGLMHADCELATLLLKIAVSNAKIELLPAFYLVVIKIVDHFGLGSLVQG